MSRDSADLDTFQEETCGNLLNVVNEVGNIGVGERHVIILL